MISSVFLDKAQSNIESAQLLFDFQRYNESASRAYYGAFQAALAALSAIGMQVERMSHEAAQATFNRELIHRRKIHSGHFKSHLLDLLVVRNMADYEAKSVSKRVAAEQIKAARESVESIKREMQK